MGILLNSSTNAQSLTAKNYEELCHLRTSLNDFLTGRVSFTLQPNFSDPVPAVFSTAVAVPSAAAVSSSVLLYETATTVSQPDLPAEPPAYELSRTITTVPDLWREWTVGLGVGPAVQHLEDTYGAAWRPSQKERVLYSRRKVIIDEIRTRQAGGDTATIAVEKLEIVRQRSKLS